MRFWIGGALGTAVAMLGSAGITIGLHLDTAAAVLIGISLGTLLPVAGVLIADA